MSNGQFAQGIDVSRWQRTVDWAAVKAAGISYAFVKATQATNITDVTFAANWAGMQANGILRGAYHFFIPGVDPRRQAAYFVQAVPWQAGDLPLVLDVESDGGLDKARLVQSIEDCLLELERLTRIRPILYTAPNFWNTRVAYPTPPAWNADYPLWIANYTSAPRPMIPKGWTDWTFWQYTDRGAVSGVGGNVDRNHFNGSEADLRQWIQTHTGQAAPTPGGAQVPAPEPAPEPTADLVTRYFAALNAADLDALASLYQPNAALVTAAETFSGQAAIRQWFAGLLARLPGGTFAASDIRPLGTSFAFNWTCRSPQGSVLDGQDTLGVLNGQINYHTTTFTIGAA